MTRCSRSEAVNVCACGAQVCARCGACRNEYRELVFSCKTWGKVYKRHIWKWTPDEEPQGRRRSNSLQKSKAF